MIILGKQVFPGEMVDFDAFIPQTTASRIGAASVSVISGYLALDLGLNATGIAGSIIAALTAGWTFQRHYSRAARGGFFLDKPRTVRKAKPAVNFNIELTEHFKKLGAGFENCVVTEVRAPQHHVYIIPNLDPRKVEREMEKVSMLLNVSFLDMLFVRNWDTRKSAILSPAAQDDWINVEFDSSDLDASKLQMFFGKDVKGQSLIVDLENDPFGLVAGMTGSGKTNLIRNGLKSLSLTNMPLDICIMDPKGDAQLKREQSTWYSNSIANCVAKLESLYEEGEERQAKYAAKNCDNYFEYQRKVDPSEKAIFILLDEMADFFQPDLLEELEKDEHPMHKRARSIVNRFIRKRRASGIFILAGIQDPNKETVGDARNQFTYRISLMVADDVASKVAMGKAGLGAEKLLPQGGMLFKTMARKAPALGRAAIIN